MLSIAQNKYDINQQPGGGQPGSMRGTCSILTKNQKN